MSIELAKNLNDIAYSLKHIHQVYVVDETTSTNDLAYELAPNHPSGAMIIAHKQTQGRGRLHRTWLMNEGDIALSLMLRVDGLNINHDLMFMLPSLAMSKTLLTFMPNIKIKWPNDIVIATNEYFTYFYNYKKLGGVLVENIFSTNKLTASIIGLGLNVVEYPDLYQHIPHAASINQFNSQINRSDILAKFLPVLDDTIEQMIKDDLSIITQYRSLCATLRAKVKINTPSGMIIGDAIAIKLDGSLVVFDGNKNHTIIVGDVLGI